MIEWAFNIVLSFLLAAVFVVGWILNNKLKQLRSDQKNIILLLDSVTTAAADARRSLEQLQDAMSNAEGVILPRLEQAEKIADELSIMIESADNIANRLEKSATTSLHKSKKMEEPFQSRLIQAAQNSANSHYRHGENDEGRGSDLDIEETVQNITTKSGGDSLTERLRMLSNLR